MNLEKFKGLEVQVFLKSPMIFEGCEEHEVEAEALNSITGVLTKYEASFLLLTDKSSEGSMNTLIPTENIAAISFFEEKTQKLKLV